MQKMVLTLELFLCFMRDTFRIRKPWRNQSGIVNLYDKTSPGSHWVAYKKHLQNVEYFDSFGDLRPPLELITYLGPTARIHYNHRRKQNSNTYMWSLVFTVFIFIRKVKTSAIMPKTLTLTGVGNTISPRYFPPIRLDPQQEYILGLVGFYGVHLIRNIGNNNEKFY